VGIQAVFGYGCSVEEHVKFGMCLDGQCGRRAKWEDVMLLNQDAARLGHGGGVVFSPTPVHKSASVTPSFALFPEPSVSVDMAMTRHKFDTLEDLRRSLQPAESPDFSPLKTASLRGDFDTVVQLCLLGSDINERDK
jgi:hypothetical protein